MFDVKTSQHETGINFFSFCGSLMFVIEKKNLLNLAVQLFSLPLLRSVRLTIRQMGRREHSVIAIYGKNL